VNVLLWHVHGSWTTAFVQGRHQYYVPVLPERGADGLGRAVTYEWPDSVRELPPEALRDVRFDAIVLQRTRDVQLVREWLGVEPGIDVGAVYVEHNAPQGTIHAMRHPIADLPHNGVPIVHVTHFNDLFWDCGGVKTYVVEHGIVDPGYRFTGEVEACAAVINEPVRRGRVTGTDLLPRFRRGCAVHLFGMKSEALGGVDVPQRDLHAEMARRRVYLHPVRWTSLGLSLIEAMMLGMPVVALATTEAIKAVPAGAGFIDTDVDALARTTSELVTDLDRCRQLGMRARAHARAHFNVERFQRDWDRVLEDVAC
jgi:hypothetical protein